LADRSFPNLSVKFNADLTARSAPCRKLHVLSHPSARIGGHHARYNPHLRRVLDRGLGFLPSPAPLSTKLRWLDIGPRRGNRDPHRSYSNLRESNLTFDSHIRTGNFTLAIPRNQSGSLEFTSARAHLAHPFPFHRANALAKSASTGAPAWL